MSKTKFLTANNAKLAIKIGENRSYNKVIIIEEKFLCLKTLLINKWNHLIKV